MYGVDIRTFTLKKIRFNYISKMTVHHKYKHGSQTGELIIDIVMILPLEINVDASCTYQ